MNRLTGHCDITEFFLKMALKPQSINKVENIVEKEKLTMFSATDASAGGKWLNVFCCKIDKCHLYQAKGYLEIDAFPVYVQT